MEINMRKVISALLAVLLLLGSVTSYAAQRSVYDDNENLKLLNALDIIGSGINTSDTNREITRAEFTDLVVGLRGARGMFSANATQFTDLNPANALHVSAAVAETLGFVDLTADRLFRPDATITYAEALKILMSALGYDAAAEVKGGYIALAAQEDITNGIGVTADGIVTVSAAMTIIRNALSAEVLYMNSEGSYQRSGVTAAEEFLKVYKSKGRVTGTYYTTLNSDAELDEDEVLIDGTLYTMSGFADYGYIGQTVEFYYREAEDGIENNELLYMVSAYKGSGVLMIDCDSLDSNPYNNKKLTYNSSKKTAKIESDYAVLNGKSELISAELFSFEGFDGGYVKLVDGDNNGSYDYVEIVRYKNYVVENAYADNYVIYCRNAEPILLDPDKYDTDTRIVYRDKYGKVLSFKDIKAGGIISMAYSEDGKYITVYLSSKTVTGAVTQISDEDGVRNVTVGDYTYPLRNDTVSINIGNEYILYLDFTDTIADVKKSSSSVEGFAYLLKAGLDEDDSIYFRMYTGDEELVTMKAAKKFKIGSELSSQSYDGSSSEDLQNINIALSATADAGEGSVTQLVKYKKNGQGEITRLITALGGSSANAFSLDYAPQRAYVQGRAYVDGHYRIDSSGSVVFFVPENRMDYDGYSIRSQLNSSVYYYGLRLYNIDKDTNVPEAAVVFYDTAVYANSAVTYAALGVVKSVKQYYSEEYSDVITQVTLIVNGQPTEMIFEQDETLKNTSGNTAAVPSELNKGDVLQIYFGSDGKPAATRYIYKRTDAESGKFLLSSPTSIGDANTVYHGKIKYSDGAYMVSVEDSGIETVADLSAARIYVYDRSRSDGEIVTVGSVADLIRDCEIVVRKGSSAYNQIIVYK